MADETADETAGTKAFVYCPECGSHIAIENVEAYILAVHIDGFCPQTEGWLHGTAS